MTDCDAFKEGCEAYWDAIDAEENPYQQGTEAHVLWSAGWLDAQLREYAGSDAPV